MNLSKDIIRTIILKIILLVALWWVCVHGVIPHFLSAQEWLLGKQETSEVPKNNNMG